MQDKGAEECWEGGDWLFIEMVWEGTTGRETWRNEGRSHVETGGPYVPSRGNTEYEGTKARAHLT